MARTMSFGELSAELHEDLRGRRVLGAQLEADDRLTIQFSDGSEFTVSANSLGLAFERNYRGPKQAYSALEFHRAVEGLMSCWRKQAGGEYSDAQRKTAAKQARRVLDAAAGL